jgi:5'-nucleotidase
LVFKAGQNANWLGVIDIHCDSLLRRDQSNPSSDDVDGALHRFQIVSHLAPTCEWSMVLNSNQPELVDKRCAEVLQSFERRAVEVEKELAIKSGLSNPAEPLFRVQDIRASSSSSAISVQADGGLSTRTELVRGRPPAAFAVLIADALAWHFSVQDRRSAAQMDSQSRIVGVINGGFIRGDSMYAPQHIVTVGDILRELPFPRVAVLVQLSAADLYAAIEQQLRGLPSQCGYTPHFSSAFQLVIDSRLPPGSRLLQLSVNGQAVQRDDRQSLHRVAMTEFMAGGGDQVDALLRGTILNVETEQVRVSTIVVLYLRSLNSQMRTGALLEISGAAPANFTDLAMKM